MIPVTCCPKPAKSRKRARKPMQRTRMKSRGLRMKKSGGHLFVRGREPAFLAAIRELPCAFCAAEGRIQRYRTECEHLKTRGSSGVDRGNTVPTCGWHREERDRLGVKTFLAKYLKLGLDAWKLAEKLGNLLEVAA